MTNEQKRKAIEEVGAKFGVAGIASIRPRYSGRGMFGAECVGVVTDDPTGLIEEAGANGLRGAKTDGMGKDYIVYWEAITPDVILG